MKFNYLIAAVAVFGLVSCGNSKSESSDGAVEAT